MWEVRNLGGTGALLMTPGHVPLGTKLRLELGLRCEVIARVVRIAEPGWGEIAGVGVAFEGEPGHDALGLRRPLGALRGGEVPTAETSPREVFDF